MNKLSIIIPVYYNEESLWDLYEDLNSKVFSKLDDYEVVMVDDGSQDNSWNIMNEIKKKDNNIKLVKLSRNFGSHSAILAGLSVCSGDCAVVKAADLQEPSELLLDMFSSWKKGNKVVLAARQSRDESFSTKFFANTYYKIVRKLISKDMPKNGFDCYLIDRKVIDVLKELDENNSALTLQVLWSGFKRDVVYYDRLKRDKGKSRWTLSKKIKLIVDSVVSFSYVPIRFSTVVGTLSFFVSIIWGLVVFFMKIFGNIPVKGFSTLMIFMLFSSGLILMMLGIIGEYVWRATDAARNRPNYIIDELIDDEKEE